MEISAWVLTNLPALLPRSAIAMETLAIQLIDSSTSPRFSLCFRGSLKGPMLQTALDFPSACWAGTCVFPGASRESCTLSAPFGGLIRHPAECGAAAFHQQRQQEEEDPHLEDIDTMIPR
ncbi:Hypothetical predicted protein [Xyrichtys novacula]|uniref:Uncharacterized protein n=1 Tax=Xyrichtys novacula TaxID=13765 RepID=A0AAV1FFC9_XYRNO|nr:Hypothetical predicted protein [Xyrichtys novacula]